MILSPGVKLVGVASVLLGPGHTDHKSLLVRVRTQSQKSPFYLVKNSVRGACDFALFRLLLQNRALASAGCTFLHDKKTSYFVLKHEIFDFPCKNKVFGA